MIVLACIVAACLGIGTGVVAAAILHESSWGRGHRAGYSDGRQDAPDATTVLHRSDDTGLVNLPPLNLPPLVPNPIVPEFIVPASPIIPTQRRRPE